jgi:hypothetical protein
MIYPLWRDGYLRFMQLAAALPEPYLLQPGKYAWLGESTALSERGAIDAHQFPRRALP